MTAGSDAERNLRDLLDYPHEDMSTEIKDWLDLSASVVRAKFAKELIALANHGGGYLLFGFEDKETGWTPSGECPFDSATYSADGINNIVKRHAEPAFECHVHRIQSSAGNNHVVIQVPGGHVTPIRIDRVPQEAGLPPNAYYIRKPGPESAPASTGEEWASLVRRCVDNDYERQLEAFRRILGILRSDPELARGVVGRVTTAVEALQTWSDESLGRLRHLEDDG